MKLYRVILPVGDIEAAAAFYSAVLAQAGQRVSPGRHYFNCEGTVLACYCPAADGDEGEPTPLSEPVYLATDDLRAVFQRCAAAGAVFPSGEVPGVGPPGRIARRPWGEVSFYASDPFGNPLCFVDRDTAFTG